MIYQFPPFPRCGAWDNVVEPALTCGLLLLILLFFMSGGLPCWTKQDVSLPGNELLHKGAVLLFTPAAQRTHMFSRGSLVNNLSSHISYKWNSWIPAHCRHWVSWGYKCPVVKASTSQTWENNILILQQQAAATNKKGHQRKTPDIINNWSKQNWCVNQQKMNLQLF